MVCQFEGTELNSCCLTLDCAFIDLQVLRHEGNHEGNQYIVLNPASFYLISFVRGLYKETKVDDKVLFNETVHLMLSLP